MEPGNYLEGRDFQVFYDGDCPLCMREIRFLQRRDKQGRISFVDIASDEFDASGYGKTQQQFMARIQGRKPSGEFVDGVEVFRRLYSAVGLSWLVGFTRIPGISWLTERAYDAFAKNRLRLTGRSKDVCVDDRCRIPNAILVERP